MIYLDNAATTFPKAPGTLERALELYREFGVSPGRGNHDLAMRASDAVDEVRAKVAAFFGAPDPARVVFGANATDALNTAILGLVEAVHAALPGQLQRSGLGPVVGVPEEPLVVEVDGPARHHSGRAGASGRVGPRRRVGQPPASVPPPTAPRRATGRPAPP